MLFAGCTRTNMYKDETGLAWIHLTERCKCFVTLLSESLPFNDNFFTFLQSFVSAVVHSYCRKEPPVFVCKSANAYHLHRECINSPSPLRSPSVSLMVVWSSGQRTDVFMSEPGICQPSSCI